MEACVIDLVRTCKDIIVVTTREMRAPVFWHQLLVQHAADIEHTEHSGLSPLYVDGSVGLAGPLGPP